MSLLDLLKLGVDFFVHLDQYLEIIVDAVGPWTYVVLFFIIFAETGFVVTPFLPGDSLIFAASAFAAKGHLSPWLLLFPIMVAAILGDSVNYAIGHYFGPRVFREDVRFLKREYLERTHKFYEKHGGKTIILARFVPIVRTFAPFVAGVGAMTYHKFILFNVVGGIAWVSLFTFLGYFFGSIPFVEDNFSTVIFAIIFLSILPPIFEAIKERKRSQQEKEEEEEHKEIDADKIGELFK